LSESCPADGTVAGVEIVAASVGERHSAGTDAGLLLFPRGDTDSVFDGRFCFGPIACNVCK
jgi:hypothetical protein